MFPRPFASTCAVLVAAMVGLTACATGERPSFATTATASADPFVEVMAARLERSATGPFTATYDVLTKFGNTRREATVTLDDGDREVVVGSVRFVESGGTPATCIVDDPASCTPELQPARISDSLLTPAFYATDTARRLRRDGDGLVGPPVSRTDTIAGQPVDCLDLPLAGGTAVYCVLTAPEAAGVVALLDDGDVRVELTAYEPTADPAAFDVTAD